jgi:hypothetical protein
MRDNTLPVENQSPQPDQGGPQAQEEQQQQSRGNKADL